MKFRKRSLTAGILVPAILVTLLSSGMAYRQLNRDTAVTADILMSQVDHVTSIALQASLVSARLSTRPCESILQQMSENGALTPYIRSTGLIRDGMLICSSVTGSRQKNALAVYGVNVSAPVDQYKIIVPSLRRVPLQRAPVAYLGMRLLSTHTAPATGLRHSAWWTPGISLT